MSDIADQAQAVTELLLNAALQNHKHVEEPATGYCRNCDETIAVGRFCDADCREDFIKRHNTKPVRRV